MKIKLFFSPTYQKATCLRPWSASPHFLIIFLALFIVLGMFLLSGKVALAGSPSGTYCTPCNPPVQGYCLVDGKCVLENPAPGQLVNFPDFGSFLKLIVNIFLTFAGAIAVIFLIIGGYQYVAARGNEEAMERAKKTVTSAILGIVIIVMAFAIVAIVNTLLTTTPPP